MERFAQHDLDRRPTFSGWWIPLIAVFVTTVLLTGWSIWREFELQRDQAEARLLSVSELRATQVEAWVARQISLGNFLSESTLLAELFTQWQAHGDASAGTRLLERATAFRKANDGDDALLVNSDAQVLAREHPIEGAVSDELVAAVHEATARGSASHTGVYRRNERPTPVRMDVVIPLLKTGTPPRGLIVLRIDARRALFPVLAAWPVPSASGESVLWRKLGDRVVAISDIRHPVADAGSLSQPVARSELALARALRAGSKPGEIIHAVDYRGAAVMASVRPVGGTDWWLVSKLDLKEIDEPIWRSARWTLSAAVFALFGVGLASRLWMQRQMLAVAEHASGEQRERLKTLGLLEAITQSSNDAIFAKDLAGRYVFYNRAASQAVGKEHDDVIGRNDTEVFGTDLGEQLARNDRLALSSPGPHVFEEMIPTPDGERLNLCARGPLFDADGQVIGLFGVSRDVTEARRAERALRDSEAHYRTVVSVLSEGILVSDPHGTVLSCNPAAERIVGVPQTDWQGRTVVAPGWTPMRPDGSVMPPEETPPGRVLAGAQAQRGVLLKTVNPTGRTIWFEVSALPVIGPDSGALMAVVTSFTEVTQRKQLEDEIERHRDKLQNLVAERTRELLAANESLAEAARFNREITDAIPGRVAYWDTDRRCRFANRSYCEWFHKRADEILGHTAAEVHDATFESDADTQLDAAMAGHAQRFERESRLADGSLFVHLVHYIPETTASGEVRGVYILAFDITALKRAQAELKKTNAELELVGERAQAANRAKSAFLANMSHEIRTPMNAIIGLTHLLRRDNPSGPNGERLARIADAAQHLLILINDILDLSKIESGRLMLEVLDFSLDALTKRACDMVAEAAREQGLELVVDCDDVPQTLRGDSTRLSQALVNLLGNAVKFTVVGTVSLIVRVVDWIGTAVKLRFEVRDTGPGIPAAQIDRLFDAFEQADSSTSRRFGGTGLGLAITRHLAQLMGGGAGASSEMGVGSTFWIEVRLETSDVPNESRRDTLLSGRHALLVDDLPEALEAMGHMLRLLGLRVETAFSGVKALTLARAAQQRGDPFDLVVIDWLMPQMDGLETARRLIEQSSAAAPACMMVSVANDERVREQALDLGITTVLQKPVSFSTLHDHLLGLLVEHTAESRSGALDLVSEQTLREQHAGARVLLAEDNLVNQEIARTLLQFAGLNVDVARTGTEAVAMASASDYALILMDMQMPELDGIGATRLLRAAPATAVVPIIAMTANAYVEDREACLAAGMNDYVTKPVEPPVLYQMLARWLPRVSSAQPRSLAPAVDRLAGIGGLDSARGWAFHAEDDSFYHRGLRHFVNLYANAASAIDAHVSGVARLSPTALRRELHSLGGASASIGANLIAEQAHALDARLRHGTHDADLDAGLASLCQDLAALVGSLDTRLASVDHASADNGGRR